MYDELTFDERALKAKISDARTRIYKQQDDLKKLEAQCYHRSVRTHEVKWTGTVTLCNICYKFLSGLE